MRRASVVLLMSGLLLGLGAGTVSAQDATPASATPVSSAGVEVVFIQSASSSSLAPVEANVLGATHELKLTGHIDPVIALVDHPGHEVGTIQASDLLATIDAEPADPPRAALVARTSEGTEEIVALEILSGAADTEGNIVYMVRVLADDSDLELELASEPVIDLADARSYMATHLFIEDRCVDNGTGEIGQC